PVHQKKWLAPPPPLVWPNGCPAGPAPLALLLGMLVQPTLHRLNNVLMLPSGDPPLLAGCAAVFDGAVLAGVGPVAAQDQSMFLVCVVVGELLAGRTNVDILPSPVTQALLSH